MTDKKKFKLTPEGSLGVLALGDVGIKMWREVRAKEGKDPKTNKTTEDGKEAGK